MTATQPITADDPIAATLAELRRRLPRPLRPAGLVTEIQDGLTDAAEAYRRAGLSEYEAARRAVTDFGPIGAAVAECGDSAVARLCRRALIALVSGYLITIASWFLLGITDWKAKGWLTHGSPIMFWFGSLAISAAVAGGVVLWRLRVRARAQRPAVALAPVVGLVALVFGAATLASSYIVSPWDPARWLASGPWTLHGVVEAISGVAQVIIALMAAACLVAARLAKIRT